MSTVLWRLYLRFCRAQVPEICIVLVQPPLKVLFHAHTSSGLSLIYSLRRRYCQLPVSGRRMQRFLQFKLGCPGLPISTGRLAGTGHVDRANRVCLACNSGAIGEEKHLIFECTALAPLRQQHANRFTPRTDTMHSFFAQQDHLGV